MNYKVMQRPMFKLGGGVIKGKQVGNRENFQSPTLEDLYKEKGELRQKAYGGIKQMLPFSVLASQMDDIRTIRKPGDILSILSNIGGSQELMGALTKLPQIDLKIKEGEVSDKIDLEKIKIARAKKTATEIKQIAGANARKLSAKVDGNINELSKEEQELYYDQRALAFGELTPARAMTEAGKILNRRDTQNADNPTYIRLTGADRQKELKIIADSLLGGGTGIITEMATGGRVGYQEGTPDPDMVMPQPKPEEVMDDRKLDTLMTAAPAMEDPNAARSMSDQDMYAALRRRLPPEITDDVVRLIAYNQEAFADFANISDQSDVESFNQKYNVELVLPVGNQ
tara:strand:+ start:1085 stop:2110 length:1026 start_codon:yes stop_codon:yes gene_type:complete